MKKRSTKKKTFFFDTSKYISLHLALALAILSLIICVLVGINYTNLGEMLRTQITGPVSFFENAEEPPLDDLECNDTFNACLGHTLILETARHADCTTEHGACLDAGGSLATCENLRQECHDMVDQEYGVDLNGIGCPGNIARNCDCQDQLNACLGVTPTPLAPAEQCEANRDQCYETTDILYDECMETAEDNYDSCTISGADYQHCVNMRDADELACHINYGDDDDSDDGSQCGGYDNCRDLMCENGYNSCLASIAPTPDPSAMPSPTNFTTPFFQMNRLF